MNVVAEIDQIRGQLCLTGMKLHEIKSLGDNFKCN